MQADDCATSDALAFWTTDVRRPQARSRCDGRRRRAPLDHDFGTLLLAGPLSRRFPLPLSRPLHVPLRRDFPLEGRTSPLSFDENIGTAGTANARRGSQRMVEIAKQRRVGEHPINRPPPNARDFTA